MRRSQSRSPSIRSGRKQPLLILLTIPAFATILAFNILPGLSYVTAAFKNWLPPQSLADAKWVGLDWFRKILDYYGLPELIRNSVVLGLWDTVLPTIDEVRETKNGGIRQRIVNRFFRELHALDTELKFKFTRYGKPISEASVKKLRYEDFLDVCVHIQWLHENQLRGHGETVTEKC